MKDNWIYGTRKPREFVRNKGYADYTNIIIPKKKHTSRDFFYKEGDKYIRVGRKFIPNGDYLSKQNVAIIKKDCFASPKIKYINKKKIRNLKGRK